MKINVIPKVALFYSVTLALLGASVAFKSPAFAAATVCSLLVGLVGEAIHEKVFAMKNITLIIPDEFRTKLTALESDIITMKFNAEKRGW